MVAFFRMHIPAGKHTVFLNGCVASKLALTQFSDNHTDTIVYTDRESPGNSVQRNPCKPTARVKVGLSSQ